MSFKKTYAFIRGEWSGDPEIFTKSNNSFNSTEDFIEDYTQNPLIVELVNEYIESGLVIRREKIMSEDGKVKINTTEYLNEDAHNSYANDERWEAEKNLTKSYVVAEAPTPEDINTFDEELNIYYHSSEYLF